MHSFNTHFSSSSVSYINAPTGYVFTILLKVEQSAFTQAFFSSLSGVHECSGSLKMAPSSSDKQTAGCESAHDWLMSLAMDLAALCDMWR